MWIKIDWNRVILLVVSVILVFTACEKPERILKFETLEAASADITCSSAKLKGEVTDLGSKPIEQHGLLLSESSVPNLGQQNTAEKPLGTLNAKKEFSNDFTGLKANTTYYFRAYVVVDGVPELASIKSFTTKDSEAPVVIAGSVTEITMTSASLGGEVTSDGGEAATVRGILWSTSANPTIATALDTTVNGTGSGTFTGRMPGLTSGTTYYARAYARNSKGTVYNSADVTFKTHNLPVVTTTAISDITTTGASSGGEVTDDGGVTVTVRGVCWSTTTGPTVALTTKTSDGMGEGVFISSITGLTSGNTYYVRAYATNQYGTSYGAELSFTASATTLPPSATTNSATPVGTSTATINGSVNANGLSTTVTFEYGTTTAYGQTATATQSPVSGSSATSVSASLTGLLPSTTYHFRVKAVSTGGTSYGDDVTFITTSTLPVVSDYDGNTYNIVTIGTQEWIQSNLMTEHYNNGDAVPLVSDVLAWSSTIEGAMCYYNDDEAAYKNPYGGFYNWYAITDVRNVCPAGWHAPDDAEWTTLNDYLGGEAVSGGKLKESGIAHWASPNSGATNETGFTGLPGGYRAYNGGSGYMAMYGYWWAITLSSATEAYYNFLGYDHGAVSKLGGSKNYGFSVRCIKGSRPLAESTAATSVASSSVTLNGKVNPNGVSAAVTFEYGTTTAYGLTATATQSPASGSLPVNVSAGITGLSGSTTYHYRVKAVNSGGTAYGEDMTFTTSVVSVAPAAATGSASSVLGTSAVLNGTVNANNSSTTVTFEYGASTSYGTEATADQSPVTGATETSVSKGISGLSASTTYHYRVKAVNAGGTAYGNDGTFTTTAALPTVNDFDGNTYNIVTIGTQEWMQKNLMVTHYSNGDAIPNITDNATWGGLTTGGYSWYNNDAASYSDTYGALYNWYVANDIRNVCPTGWHVPTDAEWTALSTYLGGEAVSGGKLKETGLTHWITPNTGATNETGFTALPAGERESDGNNYSAIGYSNFLWSSTLWDAGNSWVRFIPNNQEYIFRQYYQNKYGYSIRCLEGTLPLAETKAASSITTTSVTLNGQVNPNNASTTVTFEYGTSTSYGTEVTAGQSPVIGTAVASVSANITTLSASTTYHYRVKAVNSEGTTYGVDATFTTGSPPVTVTDYDGNVYNVVTIGTQDWMGENLKTTKYSTGDAISSGMFDVGPYGRIYTWNITNDYKNICPVGWHIPSEEEWNILLSKVASPAELKESGTTHWLSPNTGATNSVSFTALPGGYHDGSVGIGLNSIASFWFSNEASVSEGRGFMLYYDNSPTPGNFVSFVKNNSFSVRCLKGALPLAETSTATVVTSTTVTMNGIVNPNDASTTVSFEYGTSTAYGLSITAVQSPVSGFIPADVNASLTSLEPGTTYHYRIKATNTIGTTYGSDMTFTTTGAKDADGNIYNSVIIGTQTWLQENLNTTKYRDGTVIPNETNGTTWSSLTSGAFCDYDNTPSNSVTYGRLYNYYAVTDVHSLCPTGWHVPTDEEWTSLSTTLGGESVAGGKLKETGTIHWLSPNTGATNETGFTALPGAYRSSEGIFISGIGVNGRWWSSTENDLNSVWNRMIDWNGNYLDRSNYGKKGGLSVRCLKD